MNSLFTSKKAVKIDTAASLSKDTEEILSSFRTFVKSLENVNKKASDLRNKELAEIKLAQARVSQLEVLSKDNISVISNFNNLLNNK